MLFNSNSLEVQCMCCYFKSVIILCIHCIKVFQVKKVQKIPSKYIMDK